MLEYYLMIIAATVLFSVQFIFTKCWQKQNGAKFFASVLFSAIACFVSLPLFLGLNGWKFEFSWFSLIVAFLYAIDCIACTVFGNKALELADLSVYSLFMMSGGMLLPVVYGLFIGESLTFIKCLSIVLMLAAMTITLKSDGNKKINFRALICFSMIFITNGLTGVFMFWHQKATIETVSSSGFLLLCNLLRLLLSLLLLCGIKLCGKRKNTKNTTNGESETVQKNARSRFISVGSAVGYTLVNGIASLLTTTTASYVNAGVQSTITTGGCLVMSAIFGLFFGEKITKKTYISLILAVVGTVCMMF